MSIAEKKRIFEYLKNVIEHLLHEYDLQYFMPLHAINIFLIHQKGYLGVYF